MYAKQQFTFEQIQRAASLVATGSGMSLTDALEFVQKEDNEQRTEQEELRNLDPRTMTKGEVIKATWKLPALTLDMYELMKEYGSFLTGSSVISNHPNPNDEDWCVQLPPRVFHEYSIGQCDEGYWEADGFSSIYCHYDGKLINIICFSDGQLFRAWMATTKIMASLKDLTIDVGSTYNKAEVNLSEIFGVKWKRVTLFRALRDMIYEPYHPKSMDITTARTHSKCVECSREAINFTCKAAKDHYNATLVCERCAGITY